MLTTDLDVRDAAARPAISAGRLLHASEHRLLLACGDLLAVSTATAISIRIWSITAGVPFDAAFVRAHVWWFLANPEWPDLDGLC